MIGFISEIIKLLSKKFKFSYKKASIFVGILKPTILLPFTGKITNTCKAIKWSYGLHTQCKNSTINNQRYCFKCNARPLLGDISDRLDCDLLDYVDNKDRKTCSWVNYIKAQKLDKQMHMNYIIQHNIILPPEHLIEKPIKKGRPKKFRAPKKTICEIMYEAPLSLFPIKGTQMAINTKGEIYKLYDFGAVLQSNF